MNLDLHFSEDALTSSVLRLFRFLFELWHVLSRTNRVGDAGFGAGSLSVYCLSSPNARLRPLLWCLTAKRVDRECARRLVSFLSAGMSVLSGTESSV
jgi:hypothetical protein